MVTDNYHGCSIDTGDLRLYSYQYQTNGTWTEKYKAQKLNANGFTGTGTKSGDDNQNPVAVAAVSADGAMTQEYLFISGSMYKVGNSGIERCGSSDMDKNRGIGGYIINNTGILDYAVGNFDGNKQGGSRSTMWSTTSRRPSTRSSCASASFIKRMWYLAKLTLHPRISSVGRTVGPITARKTAMWLLPRRT